MYICTKKTALALLFQLLGLFIRFSLKTKPQKIVALKMLNPLYQELSVGEQQRVLKYGLYVPLFIGESFARLRNSALTYRERTAITSLGCMTALFDDLFDEQNYSDEFIRDLLKNPIKTSTQTAQIKLLIDLHAKFLELTLDKTTSQKLMLTVFEAQVAARKQLNNNITEQELETNTYHKGGFTMQLYRRAFGGAVSATEDALFYQLGAIGQLENDIFDIYLDYWQGINTLATTCIDMALLKTRYTLLRNSIVNLIEQTAFENRNNKEFKQLCVLIMARGEVALIQLHELQKKTNNQFCIEKFHRTELVCDMEKTKNRVNLLRYAAKCLKK